jgi:hypothetical protein
MALDVGGKKVQVASEGAVLSLLVLAREPVIPDIRREVSSEPLLALLWHRDPSRQAA